MRLHVLLVYNLYVFCIIYIHFTICFVQSKFVSKLLLKIMYYQYITSNLRVFEYTVSYMCFALYVYIITFVLFCQHLFIKLLLKHNVLLVHNPKPKSICICTHSAIYVFCLICLYHNIYFVYFCVFVFCIIMIKSYHLFCIMFP